jgi:hypothetical protein
MSSRLQESNDFRLPVGREVALREQMVMGLVHVNQVCVANLLELAKVFQAVK